MKKKEEISRGVLGHANPLAPYNPRKNLKVKTKFCAICGILDANLKKCSTLKFMMNISFVLSICFHRSIILIFIEKSMLVDSFSHTKKYFSVIFDFHLRENPCFHDQFQAMKTRTQFCLF